LACDARKEESLDLALLFNLAETDMTPGLLYKGQEGMLAETINLSNEKAHHSHQGITVLIIKPHQSRSDRQE
jgi:hypothetical protein